MLNDILFQGENNSISKGNMYLIGCKRLQMASSSTVDFRLRTY